MRILALDLGTKTGWAVHLPDMGVESGVEEFTIPRSSSPGLRFLRFRTWIHRMIEENSPELIVFEQPHHRGGAATELLVGFSTRVQEAAAVRNIEHTSVHTAALKIHMTGKGNSGKPAMMAAATERFPGQTIIDDNQGDALCALAWALDTFSVRVD